MSLTDEQKELVQPFLLKRRETIIRNKLSTTFHNDTNYYESDVKTQLEAAQISELTTYDALVQKIGYFTLFEFSSVLITDGNELILAHPEVYDDGGTYHFFSVSVEHQLSYLDIAKTELCMDLLTPIYRITDLIEMHTLTSATLEEISEQIFPKELFSKLAKRARLMQDLNLNT